MSKIIKVELTASPNQYLHDFRNFGEDVYRDLRGDCGISIDEIDAAMNTFHIRDLRSKFVRSAMSRVLKIARKHKLDEMISITELSAPSSP